MVKILYTFEMPCNGLIYSAKASHAKLPRYTSPKRYTSPSPYREYSSYPAEGKVSFS